MRLVICPAAHLGDVLAETAPDVVIRLASPDDALHDLPPELPSLALRFHDIAEPRPGLVAPDRAAIDALLAFGRAQAGAGTVLLSCFAGISRSTAAALALAAALRPDRLETELARALRDAAPLATPNAGMIALADTALGREGRLVAATRAIGRGADWAPFRSVALDLGPG
ncbi:MAG: tyrosine protein phosphatase [Methylobacteriaceae bacterium]|nr:tyrosine protein phosphatase [Methylobacteriaceae bacterium]